MAPDNLMRNYRHHRDEIAAGRCPSSPFRYAPAFEALRRSAVAVLALRFARDDLDAGKERYWSKPHNQRRNAFTKAHGSERLQWIDDPAAIGLRKVDYADKIIAGIEHEGWFADEYGRATIRGVVYQLPARCGLVQFVAGYEESENPDAVMIDFGEVYRDATLRDQWDHGPDQFKAARDAARRADDIARETADEAREYDRAYQAGELWAELGEEIEAAKADAREAIRNAGMTCREAVADMLETVSALRRDRRDLMRGDYHGDRGYLAFWPRNRDLRITFNEGAGADVLAIAVN